MLRKTFIIIFIIIFIFGPVYFIFSNVIYALGVRPLIFNFDMQPGDSRDFEIYLTPSSITTDVEITFYNPIQNLSGGLNYELGELEKHQVLNWISLDKNQVSLPAGEIQIVRGTINVPYNASGTYIAVLMIEEIENDNNINSNVFNFQVRYAARIIINVLTPAQRIRAELKNIGLNKNGEGNPQIIAHIVNNSSLYFNAEAEATLRDDNNRLIERLNIISEAAFKANKLSTRIYPASEVIFKRELSQPIYPGEYILQIHLKYGDNQQLVERNNITIEEELRKSGPIRYISFEPEMISAQIKAGSAFTQIIELNNLFKEKINVKISQKEVLDSINNSIFNLGELQLRGGKEFIIDSRKSKRSVFILRSPRDAEAGGYYGQLNLEIFDENNQLLEQKDIDLEILVGDSWAYNTDIKEIKFENGEEIQHFSLNLKNLSPIHIIPAALVVLKDDNDQIIKTINLYPAEDINKLLPQKTILLTGRTADIKAGNYTAEIIITHQNKEINKTKTNLNIE